MKIGILISGRGSNMAALADAVAAGDIVDSQVAVVISDKAAAAGLAKAMTRGIATAVIEKNIPPTIVRNKKSFMNLSFIKLSFTVHLNEYSSFV